MTFPAQRQKIIAKKYLGQHFLSDPHMRDRMISACDLRPEDTVLEIGPGLGVLTKQIADRVRHIYAVEKDSSLCQQLKESIPAQNLTVIHNDILRYDLQSLPAGTKVIGNLPYYISSPIMEKFLIHTPAFKHFFFTVQLEFGQRLNAQPNTKDYSALTCFAQYYADAKMLFKISPSCFSPPPKVQSCFMHLQPREPREKANNTDLLFKIIHHAFQQRRKKIPNSLTSLLKKQNVLDILGQAGINMDLRPENITLKDYVRLANTLDEILTKEMIR